MHIRLIIVFLLILVSYSSISAQLVGNVSDSKGEPLSFATVYVKNTTLGTTANVDGDYEFSLAPGNYDVIFQYVGFKQKVENITIANEIVRLDVQLSEESVGLTEVVVKADGEDPAYAIIRKAMDKRKYYLNQIEEYSCKTYTKGNQRVADVPKKFMGIDIGDLGGVLDTTGNGIVYLSESVSNLYFKAPNQYKEEMISSKVSGDDNGFSFNQARALGFNFYENTYDELGRGIVSPIAYNAFNYYKYKLEGAFVDESGRLVNKIEVFRKRDTDPSLGGYIYIIEDLWNIHSVDMWTDGKALGISILDSIHITQVNVPVREPDVWKVFSTSLSFKLKVLGIKLNGLFTGVYTDYNLDPDLDPKFFKTQELLTVEEEANEKDSTYWEAIRPIPLTEEEVYDYKKKDSLQVVWKSKEFLDSVDRVSNKFKFMKLFSGYTYSKSYKKWSLSIASPITGISFNTVQGYYGQLNTTFHKDLDEKGYRFLDVKSNVLYGFSDKQFRGTLGVDYNLNKTNYTSIGVSGGRAVSQFNDYEPVTVIANTFLSLMFKRNDMKLYDKYFARVRAESELFNGFFVKGYLEYADRSPLINTTNHSWFYRDSKNYQFNNPFDREVFDGNSFDRHQALTIGFNIRIRFKQEYLTYPGRKYTVGSKYPELHINYKRGLPILGADTNYDFLSLAIKDDMRLGTAGVSSFNLEGGMFLSDKAVPFIDFHHFNGKETFVMLTSRTLDQFRMLEYYEHSTTLPYAKLQWEHHFDGVILGKIPGVRKLQWELVAGANVLYSDNTKTYSEFVMGINKIGYGLFKVLRVDFVTQLRQGMDKPAYKMMVGINF